MYFVWYILTYVERVMHIQLVRIEIIKDATHVRRLYTRDQFDSYICVRVKVQLRGYILTRVFHRYMFIGENVAQ